MELQSRIDELTRRGLGVAAISYDPPAVLADFAGRRGITFPLLSDPGSATIAAYGLLNTTVPKGSPADGIPFPGTFVLDRQGRVTDRFFEEAYQERYTVNGMLVRLGAGPERPATEATTAHLRVAASASDATLVPGRHVSLIVDVTPAAGIHVYAPGAKGYRVVSLVLDDAPAIAGGDTIYPQSEPYVFAPLNETVPVFKSPFRLARDVLVRTLPPPAEGPGAAPAVTINGRLEYQACDDRVCFNPVSVPLSWTFAVGALDRERSTAARGPGR